MEQNDRPRPVGAKSMQELVLEQLERERAQANAAQNTAGLLGQLSAGDGLYSGGVRVDPFSPLGVQSGQWQHRTYQVGTTVSQDKDNTIMTLSKLNRELQQRIEMLEKILAHPDRQTIQSIEGLIENVDGQSVYRAGAPFTAQQVFAEVMKGDGPPKVVELIDREGRKRRAVVTGVTVVTGDASAPVAYHLTNIKMEEMNKKQVIADLVASIIEDRVMDSIRGEMT